MIKWNKPSEKLPESGQDCFIAKEGFEVLLRLPYKTYEGQKNGIWIDFFATPEAGHAYTPENIDWWVLASEILPEGEVG